MCVRSKNIIKIKIFQRDKTICIKINYNRYGLENGDINFNIETMYEYF